MKSFLIILFIAFIPVYAQQNDYIQAIGDSLLGKMIDGESVRESMEMWL